MKREDAIKILGVLKTAYPRFYANITKEEAFETINLWTEMFSDDDVVLVTMAVKQLITELQFPPTIADVKQSMYKLTSKEVDNMELWDEFDKAVRNCLYKEKEVFDGLPPIIQKFVGSPYQLREYATSPSSTFCTVTKGQFLKQIEILKKREKDSNMLLPEVRNFLLQSSANDAITNLLN